MHNGLQVRVVRDVEWHVHLLVRLRRPPMSEEARQQAEAEGLTLLNADNSSGYFGVCLDQRGQPKPYQARVRRGGNLVHLGTYDRGSSQHLVELRPVKLGGCILYPTARTALAHTLTEQRIF